MKPAHLRIATFVALLVLVCERAFGRLQFPDVWAEDGTVFLSQAAALGWASLLKPFVGVYFALERLIILVALQALPLPWLPVAVTLSSFVVLAGVMSRIVSPAYEWLIPSTYLRVLAALMFCLVPGLVEGTGNLCGLPWILFWWLAFVGLKDPSVPLTWIEVGLSVLVTLSIGTAILLVPLFTWRLVVSKDRISRNQWARGIAQLAIVIVLGVVLPLLTDRGPRPPPPSMWDFAPVWYEHVARLVAFTPWLGTRLTIMLLRSFDTSLYFAGKVIFLVFFFWWAWRHRRDIRAQGVLLLVVSMSGWIVLAVMARSYALEAIQLRDDYGRYSLPMSLAGVLYWLLVLGPWAGARGIRQAIVVVFLVLNVTMSLHADAAGTSRGTCVIPRTPVQRGSAQAPSAPRRTGSTRWPRRADRVQPGIHHDRPGTARRRMLRRSRRGRRRRPRRSWGPATGARSGDIGSSATRRARRRADRGGPRSGPPRRSRKRVARHGEHARRRRHPRAPARSTSQQFTNAIGRKITQMVVVLLEVGVGRVGARNIVVPTRVATRPGASAQPARAIRYAVTPIQTNPARVRHRAEHADMEEERDVRELVRPGRLDGADDAGRHAVARSEQRRVEPAADQGAELIAPQHRHWIGVELEPGRDHVDEPRRREAAERGDHHDGEDGRARRHPRARAVRCAGSGAWSPARATSGTPARRRARAARGRGGRGGP